MTSTRFLVSTLGLSLSFALACGDDADSGGGSTDGNSPAGAGGEGGDGETHTLGGGPTTGGTNGLGEGGAVEETGGTVGVGGEPGMGGTGTAGEPGCDPGETQCNGTTVEECLDDGTFSPIEECEGQCLEGECVEDCDPGATQCIDGSSYECDDDGVWQVVEECAAECDCTDSGTGGSGSGTGGRNGGGGPGPGGGTGGSDGGSDSGTGGSPGGDPDCTLPDVASQSGQAFEVEANSHEVDLPATDAGDLLLVLLSSDGRASVTTPDGWTALYTRSVPFDVNDGLSGSAYAQVAEDSGATTVDFVTDFEEQAAAQVYRIAAGSWYGQLGLGVAANSTDHDGSTGNVSDPPELDLSADAWGDVPILWIAVGHTGCCANSSSELITGPTAPTSFGSLLYTESGVGSVDAPEVPQWAQISSAQRAVAATSQDPTAFSTYGEGDATFRVAGTIAVRPACP